MRPAAALALALPLAACLDVAEERTLHDARVGRAAAEGVSVEVDEGLAAVRAVGPGGVVLRAGAPALGLALTVPPGLGPLSLTVDNVLADAELRAEGPAVGVERPTVLLPTRKRWTLRAPEAGGAFRLVLAPPDAGSRERFRFGVFADVQEKIEGVGDIYARMNQDPRLRFVLVSGDLTEQGSEAELVRFLRELEALRVPAYATLGNHELGRGQGLFHLHFGRGNYSFEFRGVRFTLLDSASATIAPTAYRWLDGWLAAARDRVHIVTMHIPPLDPVGTRNGAFASRAEAGKLLARLADGGVDLTVYGHVHSYYAFSNAGIPAYITGGGGAIPERFDGIGRHYLAVEVDPVTGVIETGLVRVD